MDSLSTRIANLSPTKRALLEQRLRQKREGQSAYQEDRPRRLSQTSAPLTMAQQRLWVLNQLEPESAFYNMLRCSSLTGDLNIAVLTEAITCVIERHESLRTTYAVLEGQPRQFISSDWSFDLTIVDLSQQPPAEQSTNLHRLIEQDSQRPFDLSSDLMLRATLFRLGPHQHLLLTVIHHIAGDGWSMGIFAHELTVLYQHLLAGQPVPLPELSIQYSDFAIWQQGYLSGERLQEQIKFWSEQLQAAPALELPTDFPRPPLQTYNGESQTICLSADLTQSLKKLSIESGTTLYIVLMSAWAILLARYSQQEDIVIGSPIANRNRAEIEPLIGLFLNTLALRIDLSGNPTYRELLKRLKKRALDAYAHQDVPFEKLLEELRPERDASRSPWFQVMFALQNFPKETLAFSGLEMTPYRLKNTTAKFDLTIGIAEQDAQLQGNIAYNTDLFKAETITRMVEQFQVLLAAVVTSPDQPVATLPILPEAEHQTLLLERSQSQRVDLPNKSLHQLFEAQVSRTPDAIAAQYEGGRITYRALNEQANRLAHYLRAQRVGPDDLVGLYVERSFEMLTGLLGILKAGAAYVPMDPDYPSHRVALMLADAQPKVVLTQACLCFQLPETEATVLALDAEWDTLIDYSVQNPKQINTPDHLAYVIYTSGSTGHPKGVMIEHRSLVNFTTATIDAFDLGSADRVLQFASVSFDAAAEEIYPCLCSGGTLVLRTEALLEPTALMQACRNYGITVLDLPTAYWHYLTQELAPSRVPFPPTVRTVLIGGEAVLPASLKEWDCWLSVGPHQPQLVNTYGPTEATVVATHGYLSAYGEVDATSATIGRPLQNVQIYVLDTHLNPVPMGVPGELYLGGVGLARGYLNQAQLTEQKFIPNPFGAGRLFRTGDRVKFLPTGELTFLGRGDHQIKIRGFRVELDEITSVLAQHPGIRDAVVTVLSRKNHDQQLVAYVVAQSDVVKDDALHQFIRERLAAYMVPNAFVWLDQLPLTPVGKVDRRALPDPDLFQTRRDIITLQTKTEKMIANIWSEILSIDSVSRDDHFFNLGGHSLLAVQVLSRLAKVFSIQLTLRNLFETPVLSELATSIETRLWAQQDRTDPVDGYEEGSL